MSSIEDQIRDLNNVSRKRRSHDKVAIVLVVLAIALGGAWGLGWLARGFIRATDPGVYDVKARVTGDYVLTDWLFGAALLLFLLALFLLLRPWSNRVPSVVTGFVAAAIAIALIPSSVSLWRSAEQKTITVLQTTTYPWWQTKYTCGSVSVFQTSTGTMWSAHSAQYVNHVRDTCDHVVVYRGWEQVGWADIPDAAFDRYGEVDPEMSVIDSGEGKGKVTVTLNGNRALSFRITDPPERGTQS